MSLTLVLRDSAGSLQDLERGQSAEMAKVPVAAHQGHVMVKTTLRDGS